MTIADSVWLATAILHRENRHALDFSVQEIVQKSLAARNEGYRPGVPVFTSKHCVANKAPNPGRYRMLLETTRGRRRLFRAGDPFHPDRQNGKIRPDKKDLPAEYQPLIDWYETDYSKRAAHTQTKLEGGEHSGRTFSPPQAGVAFIGPAGSVVIPDAIREELGIGEGARVSILRERDRIVLRPVTEDHISRLRGSCKGGESLVAVREREHKDEQY
jgi:AbrB family looped-hinge helix DNA binding protein